MEPPSQASTEWSRRRAATNSDLCDPSEIWPGVGDALRTLLIRSLEGRKPAPLSLEPIASKRQSACLLERPDEAVLLFDLSQSLVLHRLFDLVRTDQPYDEMARVLGACAGLAVADESPALCDALLSLTVPQEPEYLHRPEDVARHYQLLCSLLPKFNYRWLRSLVHSFLIAHEVAHFRHKDPAGLPEGSKASAEIAFKFALSQVCYEDRPNFEDLVSHHGALPTGQDDVERIRRDLVNRRRHYEENRDHLIEEIFCDSFALLTVTNLHMSAWRPQEAEGHKLLESYLAFAQAFFLIAILADLHQAMIQRAKLSLSGGVESEKPGDIADMHLRKMALMCAVADQGMSSFPESEWTQEKGEAMLQDVTALLGAQKQALDALVVMPVTRVIRARIIAFEKGEVADRGSTEGPVWRGRLGTMLGEVPTRATFRESAAAQLVGAA